MIPHPSSPTDLTAVTPSCEIRVIPCAPTPSNPPVFSIRGRSTRSGMMAMSWNSRTPSVADPKRVGSSPRSDRIWSTKAEEERARAAPMTTASSASRMFIRE